MQVLRAVRAVNQCGVLISPGCRRFRGKPSVLARGRLAVWNSLEREYAAVEKAAHLVVLGLRDRRAGRAQVSRTLMSSGLDAVGCRGEVRRREADTCRRRKYQRLAPGKPRAGFGVGHESPFLDRCRDLKRDHSRGPEHRSTYRI